MQLQDYILRDGSRLDRALLVKFMQRTYRELYPEQNFAHLAGTIEQYFSTLTPLWWVEQETKEPYQPPIGCLWLGNAIDQVSGERHTHIFLIYVAPEHRRRGIGTALIHHAETWAKQRGDHRIGLQVFVKNKPALNLYSKLGYQPQSFWMQKPL